MGGIERQKHLKKGGAVNGWLGVALLFAVCCLVYGGLCSYPRMLAVYSDELRYLDIARSLLRGDGLVVRNMPSDYQKILYPICIMPALLFKSTAAQITAIGWLNAVYMASAVFPVYALAKLLRQGRGQTVFLLALTALLPTNAASATFMSETVFLPLSLWMVYFMLRSMAAANPRRRAAWCALCGVWGYLLYLNKEVALYYLLAYLGTRLWWLVYHKDAWRAEIACWAALLAAFGGCFAAGKAFLFAGLGNSYNQMGWLTPEQWRYLPFALVCDTLFILLAFGVVPVLLPLCGLRRPVAELAPGNTVGKTTAAAQQETRRQLPLFLLLCLGIGIAVVVYTITVREDLNLPNPRQHTRYLEPLLLPLLMALFNTLGSGLSAARRRLALALTAVWGVGFVVLCTTIGAGAGDNTFLQWFDFVTDRLDRLPLLPAAAWGVVWRVVVAAGAVLLSAALLRLAAPQTGKTTGKTLPALAAVTLAVGLFCNASEQRINRWTYQTDAGQIAAASILDSEIADLAKTGNLLFIANGVRGNDSRLIDTYIQAPLYLCEYTELQAGGQLADGILDLTTETITPEYPGKPYTGLHAADYLLVADGVPVDESTLTPANAVTPAGYTLYKNSTPGQVRFTQG